MTLFLVAVFAAFCLLTSTPERHGPTIPENAIGVVDDDSTKISADISVVIHQSTVNDLLRAIGELKGEGSALFKSRLTRYKWTVSNPRVVICDTGAVFLANVRVVGFGTDYESKAVGLAYIEYDPSCDQIDLRMDQVLVDLKIKLLGREIKLGKLDVAGLYGGKIKLLGPLPLQTDFAVKKQLERMHVNFAITGHKIRYGNGIVTIDFETSFEESKTKPRIALDPEEERAKKKAKTESK